MKRFFPFIGLLILSSCFDQNDCVVSATNLVRVDLVTLAGVAHPTSFITVRQDSLGPFQDSTRHFTAYEKTVTPISALVLPLNPIDKLTYYTFTTSELKTYHLTLSYTTYVRVISNDCGAFLYYENLDVVPQGGGRDFDSTRVISPQLFQSVKTNIKLFY